MKITIEEMVEEIKKKLQVVNEGAIQASSFSEDHYEELEEIYELIVSKDTFSLKEIEAIITELGKIRN